MYSIDTCQLKVINFETMSLPGCRSQAKQNRDPSSIKEINFSTIYVGFHCSNIICIVFVMRRKVEDVAAIQLQLHGEISHT